MKPSDKGYGSEYEIGSSTSSESVDYDHKIILRRSEQVPNDIAPEKERYTSGKPRRIIIRARITHD